MYIILEIFIFPSSFVLLFACRFYFLIKNNRIKFGFFHIAFISFKTEKQMKKQHECTSFSIFFFPQALYYITTSLNSNTKLIKNTKEGKQNSKTTLTHIILKMFSLMRNIRTKKKKQKQHERTAAFSNFLLFPFKLINFVCLSFPFSY